MKSSNFLVTMADIQLIPATRDHYPLIQNMARFYVYDMARHCGRNDADWALPQNGLYECFDLKHYFEDPTRRAYLVTVNTEHAGFVLLNQVTHNPEANWNMGEFFILSRFQGQGVGQQIAAQIFSEHPGLWEVSVIPENTPALFFWQKTIARFTDGQYSEKMEKVTFDTNNPQRIIFSFETRKT